MNKLSFSNNGLTDLFLLEAMTDCSKTESGHEKYSVKELILDSSKKKKKIVIKHIFTSISQAGSNMFSAHLYKKLGKEVTFLPVSTWTEILEVTWTSRRYR